MHKFALILFILNFLDTGIFAQRRCNGGAKCVLLEACTGLYSQLQQGTSPQLTALLRTLHCGFQNYRDPMICCPPEYESPFERFGGGDPTSLLPSTTECGIQNADRIVGGTVTEIDEHPWMALLRYDKPRGYGYYCGGVLFSAKYVLTAAHCVKGQDLPTIWRLSQVRLGEYNTSSQVDCSADGCNKKPQDIPIEEIIPHEGYNAADNNQHNDIALLRLQHDAQYTFYVKPICLPLTNEQRREAYVGYDLEVAGWGKTESRSESDVKLKVVVPVMSNAECSRVFSRVSRSIVATQMCAGGSAGRDSCRGDSGGSLMGLSADSKNWLAIGVVSYGPSPCGTPGWPGVYTRVGAYIDWILSKLRP